jgi:AraC family transcriptional activator of mtrCDE
MDAISKLIRMARPEAAVDVRCLLAGGHVLDNPPSRPRRVPFHLLLSGHCMAEVPGRTLELRPGDVLMLPRGCGHRLRVAADGPPSPFVRHVGSIATERSEDEPVIDLFCGHYTYQPGAGELLFGGLPAIVHASLGVGEGSPLHLLGELIRAEATLDGPGAGALLASLCEALLAFALRGATTNPVPPWTAVTDPGLRAVVDVVASEPGKRWTISGLARVAGVSRATLVRHFSAATGMGVAEFLTRTRMTIAADLLTGTDRGLDDIAAAVGYRSASAFGKAFREATGSTPANLRRAAERR